MAGLAIDSHHRPEHFGPARGSGREADRQAGRVLGVGDETEPFGKLEEWATRPDTLHGLDPGERDQFAPLGPVKEDGPVVLRQSLLQGRPRGFNPAFALCGTAPLGREQQARNNQRQPTIQVTSWNSSPQCTSDAQSQSHGERRCHRLSTINEL